MFWALLVTLGLCGCGGNSAPSGKPITVSMALAKLPIFNNVGFTHPELRSVQGMIDFDVSNLSPSQLPPHFYPTGRFRCGGKPSYAGVIGRTGTTGPVNALGVDWNDDHVISPAEMTSIVPQKNPSIIAFRPLVLPTIFEKEGLLLYVLQTKVANFVHAAPVSAYVGTTTVAGIDRKIAVFDSDLDGQITSDGGDTFEMDYDGDGEIGWVHATEPGKEPEYVTLSRSIPLADGHFYVPTLNPQSNVLTLVPDPASTSLVRLKIDVDGLSQLSLGREKDGVTVPAVNHTWRLHPGDYDVYAKGRYFDSNGQAYTYRISPKSIFPPSARSTVKPPAPTPKLCVVADTDAEFDSSAPYSVEFQGESRRAPAGLGRDGHAYTWFRITICDAQNHELNSFRKAGDTSRLDQGIVTIRDEQGKTLETLKVSEYGDAYWTQKVAYTGNFSATVREVLPGLGPLGVLEKTIRFSRKPKAK